MDEKKTDEKAPSEDTAKDSEAGDKPKELNVVERANIAAERLEKATAEAQKENDRQERILAEQKLGGKSGVAEQPEKPKEVDNKSYAQAALEGKLPEGE